MFPADSCVCSVLPSTEDLRATIDRRAPPLITSSRSYERGSDRKLHPDAGMKTQIPSSQNTALGRASMQVTSQVFGFLLLSCEDAFLVEGIGRPVELRSFITQRNVAQSPQIPSSSTPCLSWLVVESLLWVTPNFPTFRLSSSLEAPVPKRWALLSVQ